VRANDRYRKAVNGVNVRLMSVALALVIALGMSSTVRADDTWHNVYHSLKRFFTGSKASPTPSVHHHVKHNGASEKGAEASSSISSGPENMAKASPSAAASSKPRVVVLPAATPEAAVLPAATPEAVVLPAATPIREASSAAKPSETAAATPRPAPRPAGQLVPDAANSESPAQSGPVLRSLSGPTGGASPASRPTATP
jgi:hypothetical protein